MSGIFVRQRPVFPLDSQYVNDYKEMIYVYFTKEGEPIWCAENVYSALYGEGFDSREFNYFVDKTVPLRKSKSWLHWDDLLEFLKEHEPNSGHRYGWWTGDENWVR